MKIVALPAIWQRPDVTRHFLEVMGAVKNLAALVVVGSEGFASRRLVEEAFSGCFRYEEAPNRPLGDKWDTGLRAAREFDFTHLLVLGSDDLVTPDCLSAYEPLVEDGADYISHEDYWIYNRRLYYFAHYRCGRVDGQGTGRLISRRAIDAVNWSLWAGAPFKSMDRVCHERLSAAGFRPRKFRLEDTDQRLVSAKIGPTITTADDLRGFGHDLRDAELTPQIRELLGPLYLEKKND